MDHDWFSWYLATRHPDCFPECVQSARQWHYTDLILAFSGPRICQDTGIWKLTSNLKTLSGFTWAASSTPSQQPVCMAWLCINETKCVLCNEELDIPFPNLLSLTSEGFLVPRSILPEVLNDLLVGLLCRVHAEHVPNLDLGHPRTMTPCQNQSIGGCWLVCGLIVGFSIF